MRKLPSATVLACWSAAFVCGAAWLAIALRDGLMGLSLFVRGASPPWPSLGALVEPLVATLWSLERPLTLAAAVMWSLAATGLCWKGVGGESRPRRAWMGLLVAAALLSVTMHLVAVGFGALHALPELIRSVGAVGAGAMVLSLVMAFASVGRAAREGGQGRNDPGRFALAGWSVALGFGFQCLCAMLQMLQERDVVDLRAGTEEARGHVVDGLLLAGSVAHLVGLVGGVAGLAMTARWLALRGARSAEPVAAGLEGAMAIGSPTGSPVTCVRCWHRFESTVGRERSCAECALPVEPSWRVLCMHSSTLARESWHRAFGVTLWGLATITLCSAMLSALQVLEQAAGAIGGPFLSGPGVTFRLGIEIGFLGVAWMLLWRRLAPVAGAERGTALARCIDAAPAVLFLVGAIVSFGVSLERAVFAVRGLGGIARQREAFDAAGQLTLIIALAWCMVRWIRLLAGRVSPVAWATLGLMGLLLLPLLVAAFVRLSHAVSLAIGDPFHPWELRIVAWVRWFDEVRWRAPWFVTLARHLWELPALALIVLLLWARRGAWFDRFADDR